MFFLYLENKKCFKEATESTLMARMGIQQQKGGTHPLKLNKSLNLLKIIF
jgi:hypothetical protein